MVASAGTLYAVGKSGRHYVIDTYIPDAVATRLTFNPSGLALSTSATNWRAPEELVITDFSLTTAPTAVGFVVLIDEAIKNGASIRYSNQLVANQKKMPLRITVPAGKEIGGLQF